MAFLSVCICGAAAVVFAVLMVLQRSLYLCAICLLAVILQVAALFFITGSPLLAFLQIMIYAGAVMVLVVVTIMAAPGVTGPRFAKLSIPWPVALVGLFVPAIQVLFSLTDQGASSAAAVSRVDAAIGPILFGPYAIATEAVTLLMFLSALALIKRKGEPT